MKLKILFLINLIPFLIILTLASYLRFSHLGYSDYQGDEVKALFIPEENEEVSEFLLTQRKGPGQFFVTFLTKLVDPTYNNEFLTRFPFALAGVLGVVFFYLLVKDIFGKKIAFFASFFMATNGMLVALSRIAQYQSFTILFMILTLYMLHLAITKERFKVLGLYSGLIFWALSLLFHYDGLFIAPLALYFLFCWIKSNISKPYIKNKSFIHFLIAGLISASIVLSFYIPFILKLSADTLKYWNGRITGDVSGKISSSLYLFTVYQPIYVLHFYLLLAACGAVFLFLTFLSPKVKIKVITKLIETQHLHYKTFFVMLWILFPYIFMEYFVNIPGTHIYAYIIPSLILLGFGLKFVEKLLALFKKYVFPQVIFYFGFIILSVFITLQTYQIFVEHNKEYPWESEDFLIWTFPTPTATYHLSLFGFPYYRNWEGIRDFINNDDKFYSSNERESITRYYVPLPKDTNKAGYYVQIMNPQSFSNTIYQEKAAYWSERYNPVYTFTKNGFDLVRIYNMEPGNLTEIKLKGF